MIAYLDASVVLRLVLGEPHRLAKWTSVETAVASALTEVECLRALDRLSRLGSLSPNKLADRRTAVFRLLEAVEVVDVSRPVSGARPSLFLHRSARLTRSTCPPRSVGAMRGMRT